MNFSFFFGWTLIDYRLIRILPFVSNKFTKTNAVKKKKNKLLEKTENSSTRY